MSYRLMYTDKSIRQLKKMDHHTRRLITSSLRKLEQLEEPRSKGKALSSSLKGFWRYRIGDYRVICEINDIQIIVIVVPNSDGKTPHTLPSPTGGEGSKALRTFQCLNAFSLSRIK